MSLNKTYILFLWCVFIALIQTTSVSAQDNNQIKILDQDTEQPIQQATFVYGNKSGVTGSDGIISFSLKEGVSMKISHVNYGTWEWTEKQLNELTKQKVFYQKSIIFNLYPVTVIVVRSNQSADNKIDIDYQDRLAHDGAAILNQIPAINSIQKGGNYGYDPVFRGFKYDQLNIVMNGAQSATAACPNRMDPPTSQMAPNMMDKIEVLKGPHALRYGTGFGGTINFIPAKLRFSDNKNIYGRYSTIYQSNGNVWSNEGNIGFSHKNYDLSLFAAWSQGNDYQSGNEDTIQANFQRGSFGANLGLKLASNQQLRLSAFYNLARDADFPALPMDLRDDDTWMFNARHDIDIDKGNLDSWNTTLYGSFVDHSMDNLLKDLNPRMLNAETDASTYNYGGRTEGIWRFAKAELFVGADFRNEGAEGTRVREFLMGPNAGKIFYDNAWQDGHISKTGVFEEYHFNTKQFQFVLSARLELNISDIDDPSDDFVQIYPDTKATQFNPSISLGTSYALLDNAKLGLWLGRAQRSGSLTERFINYFPVGQDPYEMLGNPQLKPEVNNQADLTFAWALPKTAFNIDVFASYMQNAISSVIDTTLSPSIPSSPGVRQYTNIDEAFKTGFEFNWTQDLLIGLQSQVGIAYTYAQDLTRDEPLPEIAPLDFRITLRGSYFDGKLKPEATFRQVTEQSRISTEYGETVSPSFSIFDIQIAYQLSKVFRFSAGVNNLFNVNYYEHLSRSVKGTTNPIYAPGRSVFATLNISF